MLPDGLHTGGLTYAQIVSRRHSNYRSGRFQRPQPAWRELGCQDGGHSGLIFKTHGCCCYWAIKLSFLAATVKEIVSVNCRSYRQPLQFFFQRLPGQGYWLFEKSRQRKDSADDGDNWRPNKECVCLCHGQRLSWHGLWEQRCSHMISPHNTSFILGRLRLQNRFIEDEITSASLSHIDSHHEIFDKKNERSWGISLVKMPNCIKPFFWKPWALRLPHFSSLFPPITVKPCRGLGSCDCRSSSDFRLRWRRWRFLCQNKV